MSSHDVSLFHSFAIAASRRMSNVLASDIAAASSVTDSIANVSAVIFPSIWAIASCFPTGAPHWTRSPAHCRQTSSEALPAVEQNAGSDKRPVLSVINASFKPSPSPQSRFSFGTRTSVKRMTPLDRPLRPMKLHVRTTSTPGQSASTMKAEIGPLALHPLPGRRPRHDDHDLGPRTVGAPELLAVE